jgi:hypothetical protein
VAFPKAAQPLSVGYGRSKFGFFVFSHARVRPPTYRDPMRFETMPSRSIKQHDERWWPRLQ